MLIMYMCLNSTICLICKGFYYYPMNVHDMSNLQRMHPLGENLRKVKIKWEQSTKSSQWPHIYLFLPTCACWLGDVTTKPVQLALACSRAVDSSMHGLIRRDYYQTYIDGPKILPSSYFKARLKTLPKTIPKVIEENQSLSLSLSMRCLNVSLLPFLYYNIQIGLLVLLT